MSEPSEVDIALTGLREYFTGPIVGNGSLHDCALTVCNALDEARSQLAALRVRAEGARREALEEAAGIAWDHECPTTAEAIRALDGGGGGGEGGRDAGE